MFRSTSIGLACALALGVGLASPAGAMGGHMGGGAMGGHMGGGAMGGHMGGGAMGGHMGAGSMGGHMGAGPMGGHMGGSAIHGANVGRGSMMAMRSDSWSGRFAQHDMERMRMGDRDHHRDRHDHNRFRFFPAFAFGVNTYADVYDPSGDCWELHRIWTHAGWRLRRIWVCD